MPFRYRLTAIFLAVLSLMPLLCLSASAEEVTPSVSAKSAILIDASDGRVIFEKNARVRMPMASTTKIMTALIALEKGNEGDTVIIPPEATGVEGSSVYLRAGERFTLGELVYAVMLASANDAATAVAIHIGGSVAGFADMMNRRAGELGLSDTHFENPHGLDAEGHYTSAFDLARLATYALKNEAFLRVVSTVRYRISGTGAESARWLVNHNRMLRSYPGAIGVKTGFTKRCGRCLVSAAERGGLRLVCVTLSAPDDWNDHTRLLDYGFEFYRAYTFGKAGEVFWSPPVVSDEAGQAELVLEHDLTATILRYGGEIEKVVEAPRFLWKLPKEGEALGRVIFYRNGKKVAEGRLVVRLRYRNFM